MILKTILVIAAVIVGVLVYASTRPATFRVERSIAIKAAPETVFALINDLHLWKAWAPQDREDPSIRRTFSGPANGAGAVSDWDSTGSAGKGRMLINESVRPQTVTVQVDWAKPFKARNLNQFTLVPVEGGTNVTWTMNGPNLFVMKVMSVFINMDKMMGKHFEQGLSNLKDAAEKGTS